MFTTKSIGMTHLSSFLALFPSRFRDFSLTRNRNHRPRSSYGGRRRLPLRCDKFVKCFGMTESLAGCRCRCPILGTTISNISSSSPGQQQQQSTAGLRRRIGCHKNEPVLQSARDVSEKRELGSDRRACTNTRAKGIHATVQGLWMPCRPGGAVNPTGGGAVKLKNVYLLISLCFSVFVQKSRPCGQTGYETC